MNGFYINITNKLLDPKHCKAMGSGSSVWEYMWCLDKMTTIDDKGVGWVLGGKPINLGDIASVIGKAEQNISKNLHKLADSGYITLVRTPHGTKIGVYRAKKRFNDNVKTLPERFDANVKSNIRQYNTYILYIYKKEIYKEKGFLYLEDKEFRSLLEDFVDMRKKINAKMTDRAIDILLRKLHTQPVKIAKTMLENSVLNSWKSVYPPKVGDPIKLMPLFKQPL